MADNATTSAKKVHYLEGLIGSAFLINEFVYQLNDQVIYVLLSVELLTRKKPLGQ